MRLQSLPPQPVRGSAGNVGLTGGTKATNEEREERWWGSSRSEVHVKRGWCEEGEERVGVGRRRNELHLNEVGVRWGRRESWDGCEVVQGVFEGVCEEGQERGMMVRGSSEMHLKMAGVKRGRA